MRVKTWATLAAFSVLSVGVSGLATSCSSGTTPEAGGETSGEVAAPCAGKAPCAGAAPCAGKQPCAGAKPCAGKTP